MVGRGQGSIVNISSILARLIAPTHVTYAGSKAFVSTFSESLRQELNYTGVTVTLVEPAFVRTSISGENDNSIRRWPRALWMSPDTVARAIVRAADRNQAVCVPGTVYAVIAVLLDICPRILKRFVARTIQPLYSKKE